MKSAFVTQTAASIRQHIDSMMSIAAEQLIHSLGFAVAPSDIRVRRYELYEAVSRRCESMVPASNQDIVALLVQEPDWLDASLPIENDGMNFNSAIRQDIADAICKQLLPDINKAVLAQYPDMDTRQVMDKIRGTLDSIRTLSAACADNLEMAIQKEEQAGLPCCRNLVRHMEAAREHLTRAGKKGDHDKLVNARALSEMSDLIHMMGDDLDRTHVPATTGPRF